MKSLYVNGRSGFRSGDGRWIGGPVRRREKVTDAPCRRSDQVRGSSALGSTVAQKIIWAHLIEGEMVRGERIGIRIDLERLVPISDHFRKIREKYSEIVVSLQGIDINILRYQIPGGMYSNLLSQLREQKALEKLQDILAEVPKVREEKGYPPLVTPTSQIVGTQATLNILVGERWKIIPKEVKNYFLGFYGVPPAPVDPEIRKKAIGNENPITVRGSFFPTNLSLPGTRSGCGLSSQRIS